MQAQTQAPAQSVRVVGNQTASLPAKRENFIIAMAGKLGMDPQKFWHIVRNTVFAKANDEECNALLMVAHEYGLNPLLKEIYAFKTQDGGIMPMIPIDGWLTMVNRNPLFAGYETVYPPEDQWVDKGGKKCPPWIEVVMFRRDSDRPYPHREYMDECHKNTGPWGSHPKRMLKHKAFIQAARYALGYSGVYDEDEARGIVDITPSGYDTLPPSRTRVAEFDADALNAGVTNDPLFIKYVSEAAKANGMTIDELKESVIEEEEDFDEFVASFRGWASTQQPTPGRTVNRPTKEEMAARRAETYAELESLGVLDAVTKAMGDRGQGSPATWNTAQCNKALEIGRDIAAQQQQPGPEPQAEAPATVSCPNRLDSDGNPVSVPRSACDACDDHDQCWGAE